MIIENIVCNFELSKELKKLNVKQESMWFWHFDKENEDWIIVPELNQCYWEKEKNKDISAFIAEELLRHLPFSIKLSDDSPILKKFKEYKDDEPMYLDFCKLLDFPYLRGYRVCYTSRSSYSSNWNKCFEEFNFVDSLARILIYLLKNKLIIPNCYLEDTKW